ncbi:MAG TPA: TIGR00645 family protein [Hyphomicrobiaceae bacterium]|nr:TIGR00645 family protein [Hyphomicrobiaceae bacterium]
MPESNKDWLEKAVEGFLFASRWILAPFYIGLALAMVVLLVKFIGEFIHVAQLAIKATEAEMILAILSLVDLALTGSLLVIVVFSGYENFVSRFDHSHHRDWPVWMGTIDFTALKLKLFSSIVAISAVQLLKQFMDLTKVGDREIYWYVVIHLTFVGSSVLLALSDRISGEAGPPSAKHGAKAASGRGAVPAASDHKEPTVV